MVHLAWLPKALVPVTIVLVTTLLRRLAPPPPPDSLQDYRHRQAPEPLPPGVIGGFTWFVGICLAISFFLLKAANYEWAQLDGPATFRLFPGNAIWCFFPGFAAIGVPWPFTVWLLRRFGRSDEADIITAESNMKSGMNSYKVMKWMIFILVVPIGVATVLAIPIHLTIANGEARLGRYASLHEEFFHLADARRATIVTQTYRANGQIDRHRDLLIDFQDGRRLDANAAGDGGRQPSESVIQFLLMKTGLQSAAGEANSPISDR